MVNEGLTENIVSSILQEEGYAIAPAKADDEQALVEPKQTQNASIDKLLQNASKAGTGKGYPDFIITHGKYHAFVCLIECKASATKHQSDGLNNYKGYAVDGCKLYSSYLSKEKDVLSIAISGDDKKSLKISHFLQLKGSKEFSPAFGDKLLGFDSYTEKYKESKFNRDYSELLRYVRGLNDLLHLHKIPEDKRAVLFSGILIALEDNIFLNSYTEYNDSLRLGEHLVNSIIAKLQSSNINETRVHDMEQAFNFIKSHTSLIDKNYLITLVKEIHHEIFTFIKSNSYFDILSKAYVEFLKYANSDKSLGIVLTPPHITALFCDLAGLTKDSVVFDNYCGTGGFLIAAMQKMSALAKGDLKKIAYVKEKQIIGIEYQDHIYTLCCSNMIIHGDGKTNIIKGSCFDKAKEIHKKPTAGLLNPPYKAVAQDQEELRFVLNNIEALEAGSLCVSILPMRCMLATKGVMLALKEEMIANHTLEAVLSMPDELFYPTGVVTAVMVIRAHQPHPRGYKTYFGYWKDDGFVKRKHQGRVDGKGRWPGIKEKWLNSYRNREVEAGFSVMQAVSARDEWCAEAYMETDYSTLTEEDFIQTIKEYAAFEFLHGDKG